MTRAYANGHSFKFLHEKSDVKKSLKMSRDQKPAATSKAQRMQIRSTITEGESVTYNFDHMVESSQDKMPLPMGNQHLNVAYVFSGLIG